MLSHGIALWITCIFVVVWHSLYTFMQVALYMLPHKKYGLFVEGLVKLDHLLFKWEPQKEVETRKLHGLVFLQYEHKASVSTLVGFKWNGLRYSRNVILIFWCLLRRSYTTIGVKYPSQWCILLELLWFMFRFPFNGQSKMTPIIEAAHVALLLPHAHRYKGIIWHI